MSPDTGAARPRVLGVIAIVLAIVGLGASIASLVDYFGTSPTFCSEGGCATVRASAWARPLGIPLPIIGIGYFGVMIALAFVPRPRMRKVVAALGCGAALCLIAIQAFVIDAWCKLCLVADPAAIALAAVVLAGAGTLHLTLRRAALAVPGLAAVVLGLGLWTHTPASEPPAKLPECVAREQVPGKVTIVEFVDFECPFCRELDVKLSDALARAKRPVHIVRKMVPLPSHTYAIPAAMSWCAADAQGKGDEMAKALFAAKPEDLTPAGCEQLAIRIGCNLEKYRDAWGSAEVRTRIEGDIADARAAELAGFPTIFIGTKRFEGSDHSADALLAAIERAPLASVRWLAPSRAPR